MGSIIRLSSSAPPRKPSAKPADTPTVDPNDALTAGGNWPFIQGTARARAVKIAAKGGQTSGTTTTELVCNPQIFDGGSGSEYAEDPGGDCGLYNKFKWAYSSYRDAFYERDTPAGQDYEYVPRLVESTSTTSPQEINSGLYGVCIPIVPDSDAEIYAILAGGFLIADFISDSPFAYDGITDYAVNSGKLSQGVPAILSGIAVPGATTGDGSQDGDEPSTGGSVVKVSGDFGGTAPWDAPSSSETGHAAYRGRFTFDMTLDLSGLPAGDDIEVIFGILGGDTSSTIEDDGTTYPLTLIDTDFFSGPVGEYDGKYYSILESGATARYVIKWDLENKLEESRTTVSLTGSKRSYSRLKAEYAAQLVPGRAEMIVRMRDVSASADEYITVIDITDGSIISESPSVTSTTIYEIAVLAEGSGFRIAWHGVSGGNEIVSSYLYTPGNDTLAAGASSTARPKIRALCAGADSKFFFAYGNTSTTVKQVVRFDATDGNEFEYVPESGDHYFIRLLADDTNIYIWRWRNSDGKTLYHAETWASFNLVVWPPVELTIGVQNTQNHNGYLNLHNRSCQRVPFVENNDFSLLTLTSGDESICTLPYSTGPSGLESLFYNNESGYAIIHDFGSPLSSNVFQFYCGGPCGGGTSAPFTLGWITEQIGKLVGFTSAQFDREDLTDLLYGATLDEVEFQNYIRDIREVFDFTVDDHDGVFHLTRIPSGPSYAPDATLTVSDLVRRPDANAGSYVHWERAEEATLPHAVEIEFYDPARLYVRGHVTAVLAGENISPARTKKFTIPFAILERDAIKRAYITLHNIWAERVTYDISVRAKNVLLTVGDVVRFPLGDYAVDAKIVSARMDGDEVQNLTLQGIVQDKAISISANPSGVVIPSPIANQGSQYIDLNIPMLKAVHGSEDRNDWLTQYHTVAPTAAFVYPGGRIWRSQNGEFIEISVQTDLAFMGTLTAVPTQQSPLLGIDNVNTMTVQMLAGTLDQLVTVSQASARAGGNRAAVGKDDRWQIVYFTTPNHTGNGIVEITGIYWGQEGTEVYVDELQQADWFILLNDKSRIKRQVLAAESIAFQGGESVSTRTYKATGLDQHPVAVESITRPLRGYPEKPYAPWKLAAEEIDGSPGKDLLITWSRRDRVSPSGFAQELPMSETSDGSPEVPEFFVEIIDNTVSPAVLRTATVYEEEYAYQASDNAADFSPALTVGDSLTVRVRQVARFRDLSGAFIDDAALYGHAAEETVVIS